MCVSRHYLPTYLTLWQQKPKVHHRIHNSPPLALILSQLSPLNILPANLPKIHSDILPSTPVYAFNVT
jgi:hypothetical protein